MRIDLSTPEIYYGKNADGTIRIFMHRNQPFGQGTYSNEEDLCTGYLAYLSDLLELGDIPMHFGPFPPIPDITKKYIELLSVEEKLSYQIKQRFFIQTFCNIPLWRSGLSFKILKDTLSAIGVTSSWKYQTINIDSIDNFRFTEYSDISSQEISLKLNTSSHIVLQSAANLYIYQYHEGSRIKDHTFLERYPGLIYLDPIAALKENDFYVVREVFFSISLPEGATINCGCFIDLNTGAIARLEAFVSFATGKVLKYDPITLGANLDHSALDAVLNPLATEVALLRLNDPGNNPQKLDGEYCTIVYPGHIVSDDPYIPPPEEPLPFTFDYTVRSNNFAAVNAYYLGDKFLSTLFEDFGIDPSQQLPETPLPLAIDHHAMGNQIGGSVVASPGNQFAAGIRLGTVNGNANSFLGAATDYRTIIHEFAHVLLLDHVNEPNLNFAHSFGDGLAAILCDPESLANDRYLTFPWIDSITPVMNRRHDRPADEFFSWRGIEGSTASGYGSEQVLSTTLFRIYLALGGDSAETDRRQFASRMMFLLVAKTAQRLTVGNNPSVPEDFAFMMMEADTDLTFQPSVLDNTGLGASHKVIRWGFEKQGGYAGISEFGEGPPPAVDVYIEDGRHGGYEYTDVFWDTAEIINRRHPDVNLSTNQNFSHEVPLLNTTNFVYVKIYNRGLNTANNIIVKGYHCSPGGGNIWPTDWSPMATASLSGGQLGVNQVKTIGPFQWIPMVPGHECLLITVTAVGDIANTETIMEVPDWFFVPNDNNIAQRNVAPIPGFQGGEGLTQVFEKLQFFVRNPYRQKIRVQLFVEMPEFLVRNDWQLTFPTTNAEFNVGGFDRKGVKVEMKFIPGKPFSQADIIRATNKDIVIRMVTQFGLIGGMTYRFDPRLKKYDEG